MAVKENLTDNTFSIRPFNMITGALAGPQSAVTFDPATGTVSGIADLDNDGTAAPFSFRLVSDNRVNAPIWVANSLLIPTSLGQVDSISMGNADSDQTPDFVIRLKSSKTIFLLNQADTSSQQTPDTATSGNADFDALYLGVSTTKLTRSRTRDISSDGTFEIRADLDGNGSLDGPVTFSFAVDATGAQIVETAPNAFRVNLPREAINLFMGDIDGNGTSDIAVNLKDGGTLLLLNRMQVATPKRHTIKEYAAHLKKVHELTKRGKFEDALRLAIEYNLGLSHTWVAPHTVDTALPWVENSPPYTDCILDIERVLAEIYNPDGTLEGFMNTQHRIQYHEERGDERNDFTCLEFMKYNEAFYEEIAERVTGKKPAILTASIDKEAWFAALNKGLPSGKSFPVREVNIPYVPFEELLTATDSGQIAIAPNIAEKLPPITMFAIVNQNRVLAGTEIPISHTGFLVKLPNGEIVILNSTPTTDAGLTSTSYETIDSFFRSRRDVIVVPKDDTHPARVEKKAGGNVMGFVLMAPKKTPRL
jgi:hypothetical protein